MQTYSADSAAIDTLSGETLSAARLMERLGAARVVLVGETHTSFADHLTQLDIIRGLYQQDPRLAIGLEFFQQPFQQALDDYVAGRIDEKEMLRRTEYFQRWKFDYRLYRPILSFARKHGIPLLALNASQELVDRVSDVGYAGLDPSERSGLPAEIDRSDEAYRARLEEIFEAHQAITGEKRDFERFIEVQLLWDESMAERAARYLVAHPERRLAVLAGGGHIAYRAGIPNRIGRRIELALATVVGHGGGPASPEVADYQTLPRRAELPPPALIGVALKDEEGALEVTGFSPDSAGVEAGILVGDRIVSIDGVALNSYPALRLEMFYKQAGELVEIGLWRDNEEQSVDVVLR